MWFFFFKQKTAYEMRISDWSSDVCSSDLSGGGPATAAGAGARHGVRTRAWHAHRSGGVRRGDAAAARVRPQPRFRVRGMIGKPMRARGETGRSAAWLRHAGIASLMALALAAPVRADTLIEAWVRAYETKDRKSTRLNSSN